MNEPRRLVRSDAPGAELLSAARAYRSPPAARRRVERMLGLPVALSLGASLSAALASTSAKVLLVAAAVTATTGGAAVIYRAAARDPAAPGQRSLELKSVRAPAALLDSTSTGTSVPAPSIDPAPRRPSRERLRKPAARPRAAVASRSQRRLAVPADPPSAVAPPAPSPPLLPPALAAELALLDAAEIAMRRHRPAEALARLEEHRRAFPDSALAEEAAVLRIAALFAANQRDVARGQAERFLTRSSGSLLADRVRSMLAADAGGISTSTLNRGDQP